MTEKPVELKDYFAAMEAVHQRMWSCIPPALPTFKQFRQLFSRRPKVDDDNPEWTEADFARAKSPAELGLPSMVVPKRVMDDHPDRMMSSAERAALYSFLDHPTQFAACGEAVQALSKIVLRIVGEDYRPSPASNSTSHP
jgi:hypothetical protein